MDGVRRTPRTANGLPSKPPKPRLSAPHPKKPSAASSNGKSKDGLNDYQRQKRVAAIEEHITELETRLEEITAEIDTASAAGDAATVQALGEEYTQTEADLETAMSEWESLLDV